jgi:hypothetical protein
MKALKFLAGGLVVGFVCCPMLAGQQPARHLTSVPDLFNQEAEASDSAGIHKYSEDLIGLIVPNPAEQNSVRQLRSSLADRLTNAEQAARTGRQKLVPEASVVKAFNELMQEIGAPQSLRTNETSVRNYREHAESIKAFPALFSAGRNGNNCNPGEAVFLLYLLMSDGGVLHESNLDSAQIQTRRDFEKNMGRGSVAGGIVPIGSSASCFLSSYSLHHNRNATIALFNNLAATLGI